MKVWIIHSYVTHVVWWALSFIGTSPRLLNWSKAKTKKWWTDITSRKQLLQITWSKISKIPALLTERLKWMSHTAKRKEKRTIRRCFEKPVWVFPGCVYTTKREMLPEFRSTHGDSVLILSFSFPTDTAWALCSVCVPTFKVVVNKVNEVNFGLVVSLYIK